MKSFVYLDEYKMYSLSSQLMKGVTDFIVKESRRAESDVTEQAGPEDSGRELAEIIETVSSDVEKRFLHDYAYAIFEDKLVEAKLVSNFDSTSSFNDIAPVNGDSRIVRVKAKARLVDSAETVKALEGLVDMQQAIAMMSANEAREALLEEIIAGEAISKPNRVAIKELDRLSKPLIRKEKVDNDKLYYRHMSAVLSYGYKGRLDISMQLSDCSLTADLKRACLKDEEDFIVKTYSRESDVNLVILGIVTRVRPKASSDVGPESGSDERDPEQISMSESLSRASKALHSLESIFTEVDENQIVLDPIAVYLEI
ncbi:MULTISPECIES: hypothetical protein [Pseudomonas syringae group]|uniref:Uncharacterized protein n=1 Tax=Pseudomonas coronafaciens pv. coronafaciens TaxID=235275 RepID=A0AAE6QI14_9PSED|nr:MULTISPECIES: hypothetical protein [Pseudomonas syringae group]MCF5747426.1 hypothetical protein [Pseudomonas tremae]QGT82967.1 hypothetical protein GMO17_18215 [Pseudomonas coronafaciens pv. coronafaciens]UQB35291.1 hypothetical protein I9H09_17175 [Pseudomonas tremae]